MCLLVVAYRCHPEFPLIVAANRDEFFRRPTASAQFWDEQPNVLAGRDLEQGGTWMGVSKHARFAALTNVRDPKSFRSGKQSRGIIVSNFLAGVSSPSDFLENLARESDDYNGFNLICGTVEKLFYFSSITKTIIALAPGLHGLSNDQLNTPWPKVMRAKQKMKLALQDKSDALEHDLFSLLSDGTIATDRDLPDTGVGLEKERWLSPIFIRAEEYGTRCSTLLLSKANGAIQYIERSFDADSDSNTLRRFSINARALT
jgi:uncharacterized protein with NRDE domain